MIKSLTCLPACKTEEVKSAEECPGGSLYVCFSYYRAVCLSRVWPLELVFVSDMTDCGETYRAH